MGEQIVASMLQSVVAIVEKEFYDQVKREFVKHSIESIRRQILVNVANQFSREVAYDAAQYVRALGSSSVLIEVDGNPGEVIEQKFKKSVEHFERWIDAQPPDSPVVTALLQKYGVKKRGNVSFVKRQTVPVWKSVGGVPRKEPWLNRANAPQDISDVLSQRAAIIFNRLLSESPLTTKTISQNT